MARYKSLYEFCYVSRDRDERVYGRAGRQVDGAMRIDAGIPGWTDGWADAWLWMEACMDGWMNR